MEIVYKILHIPTGKFVSTYYLSTYPGAPITAGLTKKGRTWKHLTHILIAWKTLRKDCRERGLPELMLDYKIQEFTLALTKTFSDEELNENIKVREEEYHSKQLQYEMNSLVYRINNLEQRKVQDIKTLDKLKSELTKLKKSWKK